MRINETFKPDQIIVLINKLNYAINSGAIKIDFTYDTESKWFTIGFWKNYERSETP